MTDSSDPRFGLFASKRMDPYLDRNEAKGKKEGVNQSLTLMKKLFSLGRDDDAKKAASDEAFRAKLYKEFNLA